jgi:hypothetical protein
MLKAFLGVSKRTQKRIVWSNEPKRLRNILDISSDRRCKFTRDDLAAPEDPIDEGFSCRTLTWLGLASMAGLSPVEKGISSRSIHRAMARFDYHKYKGYLPNAQEHRIGITSFSMMNSSLD